MEKENENQKNLNRKRNKGKGPVRKIRLRPKDPANKGKKPGDDNQPGKKAVRNLMLWLMIAVGFIILAQILAFDQKSEVEISFTEFKSLLNNGAVENATIIENDFHGELYLPITINRPSRKTTQSDSTVIIVESKFKVILPTGYVDQEVLSQWDAVGLKYNFQEKTLDWVGYLVQLSPWILIFVFWFLRLTNIN